MVTQSGNHATGQTTLAAMRAYQVIARNAITKYTAALAATKDATKIANLQKDIAGQQDRLNQIAAWLTANGQTP